MLFSDSPEPIECFEWLLENHDTGTMERERKAAQVSSIKAAFSRRQFQMHFCSQGTN